MFSLSSLACFLHFETATVISLTQQSPECDSISQNCIKMSTLSHQSHILFYTGSVYYSVYSCTSVLSYISYSEELGAAVLRKRCCNVYNEARVVIQC